MQSDGCIVLNQEKSSWGRGSFVQHWRGEQQASVGGASVYRRAKKGWRGRFHTPTGQGSTHIPRTAGERSKDLSKWAAREDILSFFLNWRIIALQRCVNFCSTPVWISYKYTWIPSFLTSIPPPYPVPLGHHRAPCAIKQLPTLSVLHVVVCICQLYSLFSY